MPWASSKSILSLISEPIQDGETAQSGFSMLMILSAPRTTPSLPLRSFPSISPLLSLNYSLQVWLNECLCERLRVDSKSRGDKPIVVYVPESPRSSSNYHQRVSRLSEVSTQSAFEGYGQLFNKICQVLLRSRDDGEYVGLYIICLKNISLAVLMNLQALHDTRHINTIVSLASPTVCLLYHH